MWMGALDASGGAKDGGYFRHYANNVSIYCHEDTDAHEVHGLIRTKYSDLNWEWSFLGYPLTDETTTPDGDGRFNHFQGGSIYWHPDTGAHEVHGLIKQKWSDLGWETSFLGYPLTDELDDPEITNGKYSNFEGGVICWNPSDGTEVIQDGSGPESCQEEAESEQTGDDVKPFLVVPSDIVTKATDSEGAIVEYVSTAFDDEDGEIVPSCSPESGSFFDVGDTQVSCTVSDSSDNVVNKSFLITVGEASLILPSWIKDVAGFWCEDSIDDTTFLEAIQYMLQNDLIVVPGAEASGEASEGQVPSWIKNLACFWSLEQVSDEEFGNAIKYLLEEGIVTLS